MRARTVVLGVSGWVVLAGIAAGKPPGPVVSPLVEGLEPPPVVRETYELAGVGRELRVETNDANPPGAPQVLAPDWFDWLKSFVDREFTIPLGTIAMPAEE